MHEITIQCSNITMKLNTTIFERNMKIHTLGPQQTKLQNVITYWVAKPGHSGTG